MPKTFGPARAHGLSSSSPQRRRPPPLELGRLEPESGSPTAARTLRAAMATTHAVIRCCARLAVHGLVAAAGELDSGSCSELPSTAC